jgi:hypothetical protein
MKVVDAKSLSVRIVLGNRVFNDSVGFLEAGSCCIVTPTQF